MGLTSWEQRATYGTISSMAINQNNGINPSINWLLDAAQVPG